MDSVFNFLADNYYIFLGISVFLLFGLIGFIAGGRKKKTPEVATASATAQPSMNQTEPTGVQIDSFAPVTPEVTQATQVTPEVSAPVTPELTNTDINAGMPLPPEEPVKSDQPTLIIEDPSTTSSVQPGVTPEVSTPVAPTPVMNPTVEPVQSVTQTPAVNASIAPVQNPGQSLFEVPDTSTQQAPAQSLFEVPNNTNQNM